MIEWGFLAKKIISAGLMPLSLCLLLLLMALILYSRKKTGIAKIVAGFALLFFYLISIQPTGDFLAGRLESQYPTYIHNKSRTVDYVLVLGGVHTTDKARPISSLLSSTSLMRLVEGIRVYRLNPGAKLLLSGSGFGDTLSNAQAAKKVARHFGIAEKDIYLAEKVKDTHEEARYWSEFADGKRMALVTSASHMPRAMFLFETMKQRYSLTLTIQPAPTNFTSQASPMITWQSWIPSGRHISRVERAWHEYLGLLWAKLLA